MNICEAVDVLEVEEVIQPALLHCARSAGSTYCSSTPQRASVTRIVFMGLTLRLVTGMVRKAG